MHRTGIGHVALVGLGAFVLGAMMFGGAATAGAAPAGAAVLWPFFVLLKLAVFLLLFGFIARMFWGRGWDGRHDHHGARGRRDWDGPWTPPWAEGPRPGHRDRDDDRDDEGGYGQDPRAWFEQRVEDWHLKAHARMDIDRLVPDPTKDDADTAADDRDVF
jgi:hypothetical protein